MQPRPTLEKVQCFWTVILRHPACPPDLWCYFPSLIHPIFQPTALLEHASRIRRLWESAPVQAAYQNRARFQLVECARCGSRCLE